MPEQEALVVVQCRFNSTRLPGKGLLPLGSSTMLGFLLRRLLDRLDPVRFRAVVATTTLPDDDMVAREAEAHGVPVVRGEVDDVMARFIRCLDEYPAEVVIRVTADNPLTCPDSISAMVEAMRKTGADYARCKGYPTGATADAFSAETLRRIHSKELDAVEREHINKHVLDHPGAFSVLEYPAPASSFGPNVSLTVDTPEEYRTLCGLFRTDDEQPWTLELHEAIGRLGD